MIRKAVRGDVKKLYHLEKSIFSKDDFTLSLSSFYYHIKNSILFVYEEDSEIVGYILWLKRKRFIRLYSLCVAKETQGKGIGDKLLKHSFNHLDNLELQLEVKTSNTKAIELYKKNGFEIKKVLKEYYPNSLDGYLMVKI